ncbi:amidase [Solicola gregarius]|uniref:Amidase n=1 Tax=Solicola gregarius TaxID=2908642 RepID=A0AA46YJW2_9ACTN|nr:amidase [Solicola gregarius]UYM04782.1 amidase [Solicola gregarius]
MSTHVHAFTDDALGEEDAVGVAERIRTGEISSLEAVEAAIARVERVDPELNAVVVADFERARKSAVETRSGPLAGVPTIVKDNSDVAGLPTGHGSAAFTPHAPHDDGDFVRQFLAQGVVNLGKSRLPEFGFNASTEFADAPPTRNPWNTAYSPGASSGGSAALVASGALPLAHANDGGGSIRIPAAACGLVGLKPTRGRTLSEAFSAAAPVKIVSEGVVTRTVRDTAHFLAGAEKVYASPRLPRIGLVEGPSQRRLRVGMLTESVTGHPTDDATRWAVAAAASRLTSMGHDVVEMPMPVGQQFADDFAHYWGLLAAAISATGKRTLARDFDRAHTDNLTRGLAAAFRRNMLRTPGVVRRLRRSERTYAAIFADYDLVLSPTLAHTTPKLGHLSPAQPFEQLFDRLLRYVAFTPLNNATGGPAISLPMAMSEAGLPIGVQLSAGHGDERTLLEIAYEVEQEHGWARIQDV